MANFDLIFPLLIKNEGGYVNDPKDSGGETYRGIARNFNKDWKGWAIIDRYKAAAGGTIKKYTIFKDAALDALIKERFKAKYWVPFKGDLIKSQEVADIFFDMYINSGSATLLMKEVLKGLGKVSKADSKLDAATINAINAVDSSTLYNRYKEARIEFYKRLAKSNPEKHGKFLTGWLKRVNESFPDLKKKVL